MKQIKCIFVSCFAIICVALFGSVFASCSNDDDLLLAGDSQTEQVSPLVQDSLKAVTRGMMGYYYFPTWMADGAGDREDFPIPSNASSITIVATKNTTSVGQPYLRYSWDNFTSYNVLYLSSSPGVASNVTIYKPESGNQTLSIKQLWYSGAIGTLTSIVNVSYQY